MFAQARPHGAELLATALFPLTMRVEVGIVNASVH